MLGPAAGLRGAIHLVHVWDVGWRGLLGALAPSPMSEQRGWVRED